MTSTSRELHDARQKVSDLEDDQARFHVPADTGLGSVLTHDYGTGSRYGLVVQVDPEIKVIWFTGNAETVDHLDPVYASNANELPAEPVPSEVPAQPSETEIQKARDLLAAHDRTQGEGV